MNASDLTPAQITWARFYSVLHEEVQKLEKLVSQKNPSSVVVLAGDTEEGLNQRQPVTSVNGNDTKQS